MKEDTAMFKKMILESARAMGIEMSETQAAQFETYHQMLIEANGRMNLTRVPEDLREAIDRNYLDCIAPLSQPFPQAATAIDVGSGAGFPGIPLSIMLPDTHFVLIDALGKRVGFLKEVIEALKLNAEAHHLRAEDAARKPEMRQQFDLATARAVASLNLLSEYLLPFVKVGGQMLALKGPSLDDELLEAQYALEILGGEIVSTQALAIPGRDWNHRCAWIKKVSNTPEKYPRKAGLPEKKPLLVK